MPQDLLLDKYIEGLLFYFENSWLVTEELLILKIKELILLLGSTKDAPAIRQILAKLFSPVEYSFREVIEAYLFSGLSVQELATLTNLSISSFKRQFGKVYQATPASFFKDRMLDKASNLLVLTKASMSDIAVRPGHICPFK